MIVTNDAANALAEVVEKMRALGEVLREALDTMGRAEAMIRAYSSEKTPLPAPGHSALGVSERAKLVERRTAPGSFSACPGCGERYCQPCAERPYEFCACADEPKESEPK